jgi:hypothetical protein
MLLPHHVAKDGRPIFAGQDQIAQQMPPALKIPFAREYFFDLDWEIIFSNQTGQFKGA